MITLYRTKRKVAVAGLLSCSLLAVTGYAASDSDTYKNDKSKSPHSQTQSNNTNNNTQEDSAFKNGWRKGKIETAFLFNEHISPFDIETKVEGNKVYLSGTVENAAQRELAENIASGVDGIDSVENNIALDPKKAKRTDQVAKGEGRKFVGTVKDASITASVKTKLLTNSEVPGMDIDVDTHNALVSLSGKVPSEAVKQLAAKLAEQTDGVKKVENHLQVSRKD